jgi:hypothetical protein
MYSDDFVRRHRLSSLANGVLIGMGLTFVMLGGLIGIVSIAVGIMLEFWQRKRIPRSPGPGGASPGPRDT